MKKVYWEYSIDDDGNQFPDEYIDPPKKFRSGYDSRYDHAKCPAWKKWTENCWVVTQPFDVGLRCDTKQVRWVQILHRKHIINTFI